MELKDYFSVHNGVECAGKHLLVDVWGGNNVSDINKMEEVMRLMALKAGATVLKVILHDFEVNGGITGVAVLAESHITVHTWPEKNFAAFDIFMCGDADVYKAIDVLKKSFNPKKIDIIEHLRGSECQSYHVINRVEDEASNQVKF